METWILFILLVIVIALIWTAAVVPKVFVRTFVVRDYETALYFKNGKYHGALASGKHRFWGPGHDVTIHDTRKSELIVQGQELITVDKATLKLTAVATYRIADAWKMTQASGNALHALYTRVQFALRQVVGSLAIDAIIEKKADFGESLLESVRDKANELGLVVDSVDIRDVMLGGDLKRIYISVLSARQEALATQEKARGEAAALRTLANAARLFENNPHLLQLRYLDTLEKAGDGAGNTLVVGMPEQWAMAQRLKDNQG